MKSFRIFIRNILSGYRVLSELFHELLIMKNEIYTTSDVCAVIVSYNDIEAIEKNIQSVISQVAHLFLIDNGSDVQTVEGLKKLKKLYDFSVYFDSQNKGIPIQLNRALAFCKREKYPLLLTMDQDTSLTADCVSKMIDIININDRIASVGPLSEKGKKTKNKYYEANYIITSGNLIRVEKALKVGGYDARLFIDMVDVDFSLSLRESGYKVVKANNGAFMLHRVGEYERRKLFFFNYGYYSHSPGRFYYIYRNRCIVCKKHFNRFPVYCIKMIIILAIYSFSICLQKNACEKYKQAFIGIRDGIRYRI